MKVKGFENEHSLCAWEETPNTSSVFTDHIIPNQESHFHLFKADTMAPKQNKKKFLRTWHVSKLFTRKIHI